MNSCMGFLLLTFTHTVHQFLLLIFHAKMLPYMLLQIFIKVLSRKFIKGKVCIKKTSSSITRLLANNTPPISMPNKHPDWEWLPTFWHFKFLQDCFSQIKSYTCFSSKSCYAFLILHGMHTGLPCSEYCIFFWYLELI